MAALAEPAGLPRRDEGVSGRQPSDNVQLKLRMKEPLRAAIERSAEERGVSMNADVIDRLERSFDRERMVEHLFGGPEVFGIAQIIARAMHERLRDVGLRKRRALEVPTAWLMDPYAYDQAVTAAYAVLERLRPLDGESDG